MQFLKLRANLNLAWTSWAIKTLSGDILWITQEDGLSKRERIASIPSLLSGYLCLLALNFAMSYDEGLLETRLVLLHEENELCRVRILLET